MIKVLIVEDEQFLRKGLILTTPWAKVDCLVTGEAASAVEGIELAKKLKPDIILTDIRMPQMSGLKMIQEIKKELDAEYVVISGYDEFDYAKTALELGVKGYLVKPIDQTELLGVLANVVKAVKEKHTNLVATESYAHREEKLPPLHLFINAKGRFHDRYVDAAIQYMQDNYSADLTVKEVANFLGISDSYLGKLVKNKTGFTFLELLTMIRMSKAIELMRENDPLMVYEIASAIGYRDTRHFSRLFKKTVGVFPNEYRNGKTVNLKREDD